MLIQLLDWLGLDFDGLYTFFLHSFDAVRNVGHLHVVLRGTSLLVKSSSTHKRQAANTYRDEHTPYCPVAYSQRVRFPLSQIRLRCLTSGAVDDEVIGELRYRQG